MLAAAGGSFGGALVAVICARACFLRDGYLATHTARIDYRHCE